MNKLLFFISVIALGFVACNRDGDPTLGYNYVYVNETDLDITVEIFYPALDQDTEDRLFNEFVIPANGEYTETKLYMSDGDFPEEWGFWHNYRPDAYAIISNGEMQISTVIGDGVGIFNLDNYTRILENYSDKSWVYVFTDDFFADGEPITPAEPQ